MKVLVPTAGADDAKLIIDFVANYRWPPKTSFKVVHVVGGCETESKLNEAQSEAEKLVARVAADLEKVAAGSVVSKEVITGSAIYEILEAADKWKTNMIVMGYRTRSLDHIDSIGSVSNGVITRAPCSVAVVRPPVNAYDPETQRQSGQVNQTSPRLMA